MLWRAAGVLANVRVVSAFEHCLRERSEGLIGQHDGVALMDVNVVALCGLRRLVDLDVGEVEQPHQLVRRAPVMLISGYHVRAWVF